MKAWTYGLIVAIGVAGEALWGIRILSYTRNLKSIQAQIDVQTANETNAIKKELADAIKQAGDANERAALAIERASILEYNEAPRVFTNAQRRGIYPAIKNYPGQKYKVLYVKNNFESSSYAANLESILKWSKWSGDLEAIDMPTDIPYAGVWIEVSGFAPQSAEFGETVRRAKELANAFAKNGVELCPHPGNNQYGNFGVNGLFDPELILIVVGPKVLRPTVSPATQSR